MLTADLVLARRRGGQLFLPTLDDKARARARDIAAALLAGLKQGVGADREAIELELDAAIAALALPPAAVKLEKGLRKLADDACTWDALPEVDPAALRRTVFRAAATARRDGTFDRGGLLAAGAAEHALAVDTMERALYADLPGAHRLLSAPALTPDMLVERWELAQSQSVLLRAVRVTCTVRCRAAGGYRQLFRRLKFLRLLHEIQSIEGGYRLVIEGPFTMFDAGTKYGLALAMVMPVLRACDSFELEAELRWGKERAPLSWKTAGGVGRGEASEELPEEVARLVAAFSALDTDWKVAPSDALLELPGVGLAVPDLVFTRKREKVYLEVLGFWSREAVWKRVELVEAGLPERVIFAVSQRLRVSAEVLDDDRPGRLYVYKGAMAARSVLAHLEARPRRRK